MTSKIRGKFYDAATGQSMHVGYFDTVEERDYEVAKAKLERARGLQPKVIEDRARGGELFVTFAERSLLHRKTVSKISPETWRNYNTHLQKWILPTFGQTKLRDITAREVDRWFTEVLPAGSPSNGQRYSVLSGVMRRAVLLEEIDRSPCLVEGVSANKSKRRDALTLSEFHVLVDAAATDQERALLWTLMGSGARIGEVLALDWSDVDFRFGEVTVSKHLVGGRLVEGTKSHPDQVRLLTMPKKAMDALATHQESSQGLEGPIFLHSRGGRMRQDTANKFFHSLRASRGLEAYRIHDVRHTSLTAYARTATLAEVMARGGHSDMRTALRYQHPSRSRDREIVAQLDTVF